MSKIYLLFILIGWCISSCNSYPTNPDYELLGEQTGFEWRSETPLYSVRFRMKSKYDSLPPFYLMTCSWYNNSVITNQNVVLGGLCDVNFLEINQIMKDEVMQSETSFFLKQGITNTKQKVRIGIIILDTLEIPYSKVFWMDGDSLFQVLRKDSNRIVWSNEIVLQEMHKPFVLGDHHWNVTKDTL